LPYVIGDPFLLSCGDRLLAKEAEDITQGFFASLLEHRNLNAVRKEQGRLRSYLLGALKYFLANERRRGMAIKRGKGSGLSRWKNCGLTGGSRWNQRTR
jgi:hypothetical protein